MTEEQSIAKIVADRLEGVRQYEVLSRETVYYSRTVLASTKEEALRICEDEGDWGDMTDGDNFLVDGVNLV